MRIAGFGFREGAPVEALPAALRLVEEEGGAAQALATLPDKAAALQLLAAERGLPVLAVPVAGMVTPTQSPRVQALFSTGSVAEAAALAAAGPGSVLTVRRVIAPGGAATCAMAVGEGGQDVGTQR